MARYGSCHVHAERVVASHFSIEVITSNNGRWMVITKSGGDSNGKQPLSKSILIVVLGIVDPEIKTMV